jgi:hypothetical protein
MPRRPLLRRRDPVPEEVAAEGAEAVEEPVRLREQVKVMGWPKATATASAKRLDLAMGRD